MATQQCLIQEIIPNKHINISQTLTPLLFLPYVYRAKVAEYLISESKPPFK